MAVDGMIGDGIFSTLVLIVEIAGAWAWFPRMAGITIVALFVGLNLQGGR